MSIQRIIRRIVAGQEHHQECKHCRSDNIYVRAMSKHEQFIFDSFRSNAFAITGLALSQPEHSQLTTPCLMLQTTDQERTKPWLNSGGVYQVLECRDCRWHEVIQIVQYWQR